MFPLAFITFFLVLFSLSLLLSPLLRICPLIFFHSLSLCPLLFFNIPSLFYIPLIPPFLEHYSSSLLLYTSIFSLYTFLPSFILSLPLFLSLHPPLPLFLPFNTIYVSENDRINIFFFLGSTGKRKTGGKNSFCKGNSRSHLFFLIFIPFFFFAL